MDGVGTRAGILLASKGQSISADDRDPLLPPSNYNVQLGCSFDTDSTPRDVFQLPQPDDFFPFLQEMYEFPVERATSAAFE